MAGRGIKEMGASNSNLHSAKRAKNDEFYTRRTDIDDELKNYRQHFRGKVVYCNCDDPLESNFFKYFALNFNTLGLKRLMATGYSGSRLAKGKPKLYELRNLRDVTGDGAEDWQDVLRQTKRTPLRGDGDFRSPECVALLKQADVVVTNPPFSLFREYIAQLVEHDKKFLVVGSLNAVTYKEIFPLIADGKLWLGTQRPKEFDTPGGGVATPVGALWYTNLDHNRRHAKLTLWKRYSAAEFPKYDNYSAINVNKVSDIPDGYKGAMGVPITFLEKHNPDQFEILDANDFRRSGTPEKSHGLIKDADGAINGKPTYARIIIRSK